MEIVTTFLNMASLFAGVLCIVAYYNASLTIYDYAPKLVTRVPWILALLLVAYAGREGWYPADNAVTLSSSVIGLLLGGFVGFSFVLCFLYGWARRGFLDRSVPERQGRFSPVMYAWTGGLLFMLAITGLNSSIHGVNSPFWVSM